MPLALFGTIAELAAATVLFLLLVFAVVNAALFVLKRRQGEKHGYFEIPLAVPALGALVCLVWWWCASAQGTGTRRPSPGCCYSARC